MLPDAGRIINLPGDRSGLRENAAPGLGIGVGVLGLALVEEALTQRVDGDSERVIVAALRVAAAIGILGCFEIGRFGIDRRHVAALPLAGSGGADRHQ